jgi:hypothetical protein
VSLLEDRSVDVADAPPDERARCQGTTRTGAPCRATPADGEQYCRHHGPHDPTGEQDEGPGPKRSQATLLVAAAEAVGIELFHTDTHDAYVVIPCGEHLETWPIKSQEFRYWLHRLGYERHGKVPGSQAVQDAISTLSGTAVHQGAEQVIAVRVAEHQDAIWLDLGNDHWEAVEVTAGGWRVVADPPVRFRRPAGLRALPAPQPGGTLAELRSFCNVDDDDWPLVLGFLVAALRPTGPYPVLNLLGAQGSAKTTTAKVFRNLIDPAKVGLRSEPRDMRDLAIAAANNQVVGFDNLSSIPTWLSDGLCRLATGGGFATRGLYSDAEEALFDFQRPVILTGIEELAVRGDLADRSLMIDLPAINDSDRRPEVSFWADYEAARPRLLGALLDAVSTALRRLPEVRLDRLPRLADFALWVAAAPALRLDADDFLKAYEHNRAAADAMAVEASPPAYAVLHFIQAQGSWTGTATELLAALNQNPPDGTDRRSRAWPKNAKALSDALRRARPNLAKLGVSVEFSQNHHPRTIRLQAGGGVLSPRVQRIGDGASPASPASPGAVDLHEWGDAPGTHDHGGDAGGTQEAGVWRCDGCGHQATAFIDMTDLPHPDCGGRFQEGRRGTHQGTQDRAVRPLPTSALTCTSTDRGTHGTQGTQPAPPL